MKKQSSFFAGRLGLCFLSIFFLFLAGAWAAPKLETQDKDKDGKVDTWIQRDEKGRVQIVMRDKHKDGKPDAWVYYNAQGLVEKRQWDRNFDGKADFESLESRGRFLEKHYDDNFDGVFEKTEKAPPKGFSGRTKTTAQP